MRFRYLRIAWSVVCGIMCLLLFLLWVWSYTWLDDFSLRNGSRCYATVQSFNGRLFYDEGFGIIGGRTVNYSCQIAGIQFQWSCCTHGSHIWRLRQGVSVPDWSVLIVLSLLGTAPWLPRQFSLRTLLIATTLVAVMLGIIVWISQTG